MTCGYIHTSSFTSTFQFTETLLLRWFQIGECHQVVNKGDDLHKSHFFPLFI